MNTGLTYIKKYKDELIQWLKDWFAVNGPDCNACVGISGGKDSSTVAALCVEALGKDRVVGVLMPNGVQKDITDSFAVCDFLGIEKHVVNIEESYNAIIRNLEESGIEVSEQTKVNLAPRLRMSTLYAVSQSRNGRVVGTGNASEALCGYYTRYGDGAYDVNPIAELTMEEVVELGLELGLPEYLVKKAPSDGLTGKTDDECFKERGYSYAEIHDFIIYGTTGNLETDKKLVAARNAFEFKKHMGVTPQLREGAYYGIAYHDEFGKDFADGIPWVNFISQDMLDIEYGMNELKSACCQDMTVFRYPFSKDGLLAPQSNISWEYVQTHKIEL